MDPQEEAVPSSLRVSSTSPYADDHVKQKRVGLEPFPGSFAMSSDGGMSDGVRTFEIKNTFIDTSAPAWSPLPSASRRPSPWTEPKNFRPLRACDNYTSPTPSAVDCEDEGTLSTIDTVEAPFTPVPSAVFSRTPSTVDYFISSFDDSYSVGSHAKAEPSATDVAMFSESFGVSQDCCESPRFIHRSNCLHVNACATNSKGPASSVGCGSESGSDAITRPVQVRLAAAFGSPCADSSANRPFMIESSVSFSSVAKLPFSHELSLPVLASTAQFSPVGNPILRLADYIPSTGTIQVRLSELLGLNDGLAEEKYCPLPAHDCWRK
eukprot:TRINITY_DN9574_c0_g1_i1.p1 TRINITY_DN9574_c0_g1~~TRINITY_DN9574_c0_g1_i1.p1  ORF type:complete len:323 (+),score=44.03 TRINITY_DN9574_c0_g1_i1:2-970(+)